MKKILAVLIALTLASPTFAVEKKPVPTKKVIKKHQRFNGTKIADDKPTKPTLKKKK